MKLILSLCTVNNVLSTKWIVDSAVAGKFLPVIDYEWKDTEFEQQFQCDVQKTIRSPIRNTLFDGKTFYMTPSVVPSIRDLTVMIECSGGKVEKQRRSVAKIAEANGQVPESYIILSCPKDLHLLSDLMRPGSKSSRYICVTEYVMLSVMTQKIDIERHIIKYL